MVGARLVWVDRKFELRDFDQTRAGVDAYHVYVGEKKIFGWKYCVTSALTTKQGPL